MASPGWIKTDIGIAFCNIYTYVCNDILKYTSDADPKLDNYQRYDVLLGHDPSGTSAKNMYHWRQQLLTG